MVRQKTTKKTKTGRTVPPGRRDAASADAPPSSAKRHYVLVAESGAFKIEGGAAKMEKQAARYVKWATKQIKASRTRSARISKRIERLSRETDAVLARLEAAS